MPKISPRRSQKTRPLRGVTRSNSGAFQKSGLTPAQKRFDTFTRKLLLSQTAGGVNSWGALAKWWGVERGHLHLMAHGKRPLSECVRERARGLYAPRKLRKFIQRVAVPWLTKNWSE